MGGFMPYGRVRNRNGLSWRSDALYPGRADSGGYPLPDAGRHYPARDTCWVCELPLAPERVPDGTCSHYHQGVYDADHGRVPNRAHHPVRTVAWHTLIADLNRMERDYLDPPAELTRRCADPDPSTECSMATGVDVDTVRRVLHHVFRESR